MHDATYKRTLTPSSFSAPVLSPKETDHRYQSRGATYTCMGEHQSPASSPPTAATGRPARRTLPLFTVGVEISKKTALNINNYKLQTMLRSAPTPTKAAAFPGWLTCDVGVCMCGIVGGMRR